MGTVMLASRGLLATLENQKAVDRSRKNKKLKASFEKRNALNFFAKSLSNAMYSLPAIGLWVYCFVSAGMSSAAMYTEFLSTFILTLSAISMKTALSFTSRILP